MALLGALLVAIGAGATAICSRIPHAVERWRPRGVSALPILFVLGCDASYGADVARSANRRRMAFSPNRRGRPHRPHRRRRSRHPRVRRAALLTLQGV